MQQKYLDFEDGKEMLTKKKMLSNGAEEMAQRFKASLVFTRARTT